MAERINKDWLAYNKIIQKEKEMKNEVIQIRRVEGKEHIKLLMEFNQMLDDEMTALMTVFLRDPFDKPVPATYWEDIASGTGGFALLAWDADRPAGMALIEYGKCAHFESLIVLPAYRHQGIGKMLVDQSLEQVRRDGYKLMTLNVLLNNESAESLYAQAGFEGYKKTMAIEL